MQKIDFAKGNGLVPVIVQDYESRDVLMVAYMNEEAWEKTKKTGKAHYYSRSRKGLWFKGEESGNFQEVRDAVHRLRQRHDSAPGQSDRRRRLP